MKYLLDTHVILWLAYEDDKLSSPIREILLKQENEIYISAVSFWEISLKYQSGKLNLNEHNPEILKAGFEQFYDFKELPLEMEDTVSFFKLNSPIHKDPFDRILIWQALRRNLALISDDDNIKRYQSLGLKVIW
jgi:PIN domain nuclease of toxin-antitoxin system